MHVCRRGRKRTARGATSVDKNFGSTGHKSALMDDATIAWVSDTDIVSTVSMTALLVNIRTTLHKKASAKNPPETRVWYL